MTLFGDSTNEFWYIPVIPLFILVSCIVIIVFAHTGTQYKIDEYNLEYEGLCKRYELIQSDYEDISKSDVVKDITFWNKRYVVINIGHIIYGLIGFGIKEL